MVDHRLFVETLSTFTGKLLTPYDVHAVLTELAASLTELLGLAGSGVTLATNGRLRFATAVPPAIAPLEHHQEDRQSGPCATAYATGVVVTVEDIRDETRWPGYRELAVKLGTLAVAGIPMRLGAETVGALNLYANRPRQWPDEDVAVARTMADMATGYLINASKLSQQTQLSEQLQRALDSRVVIEQAKGVVANQHGVTVDEAFQRIRRYSRSRNVSVREVSETIVTMGLRI